MRPSRSLSPDSMLDGGGFPLHPNWRSRQAVVVPARAARAPARTTARTLMAAPSHTISCEISPESRLENGGFPLHPNWWPRREAPAPGPARAPDAASLHKRPEVCVVIENRRLERYSKRSQLSTQVIGCLILTFTILDYVVFATTQVGWVAVARGSKAKPAKCKRESLGDENGSGRAVPPSVPVRGKGRPCTMGHGARKVAA